MNTLYHAWVKRGEAAKEHKYIRRYWKNGRWNYVYDDSVKFKSESNSRDHYTRNEHKTILPKKWASDTNEWNGKFVKGFVDSEKAKDINKEYADRLNSKYNPYDIRNYKEPSWLDKARDKLGYDERYTYGKAARIKSGADDFANGSRKEADSAYDAYKRLPDDFSYEHYQLKENIAQITKADAETAGKLYARAQKEFFDTPLGKIEKAKDDVRDWVNETIESISKRAKKRKK